MAKEENKTQPIETIEDLTKCYPALVGEITANIAASITEYSVDQFKKSFPKLFERIAESCDQRTMADLKVPGFLLDTDDPFAEGTLRTFSKVTGKTGLRLPMVLPFKNKATIAALENYILRAGGAGDAKRVKSAQEALAKVKV